MRCKYATGECNSDPKKVEEDPETCFLCIIGSLKMMHDATVQAGDLIKVGYNLELMGRMLRALAFWGEDLGFDVKVFKTPVIEDALQEERYVV